MDWQRLLSEILTVGVAAGWLALLAVGLEPDKPLSGGIPGNIVPSDTGTEAPEGTLDRVGETVGWIAFVSLAVVAVFVLVWILRVHG